MQDSDLDDFLAAARAGSPVPSAALFARIEADARRVQAARAVAARPPAAPARPRSGRFAGWIAGLGGRGVLAGLVTATAAGLWLGVAQPAPVLAVTEQLSDVFATTADEDAVDLIPGFDDLVTEG